MKEIIKFEDGDYIIYDEESVCFYDCDDCLVKAFKHDEEMADEMIDALKNKVVASHERQE